MLTVANTGPEIPSAAVSRLFRPFQQLGPDRTGRSDGLGLGLSIASAIAEAHNAAITARPRPGGGLAVEVTFPDPARQAGCGAASPTSARTRS